MMGEMKPCPFCGGEAEVYGLGYTGVADCVDVNVCCSDCHAQGETVVLDHSAGQSEEDAASAARAAWNRRTPPTTQGGEGEKLVPRDLDRPTLERLMSFFCITDEEAAETWGEIYDFFPAAPPAPASDHVGEGEHQRDLLADALGRMLIYVGMTRPVEMTGPELLLAAETFMAAPSPDHAALVGEARELRAFLDGSGELEGVSFGDRPVISSSRGAFWWRKYLDRIDRLAAALHPSAEGGRCASVNASTEERKDRP